MSSDRENPLPIIDEIDLISEIKKLVLEGKTQNAIVEILNSQGHKITLYRVRKIISGDTIPKKRGRPLGRANNIKTPILF